MLYCVEQETEITTECKYTETIIKVTATIPLTMDCAHDIVPIQVIMQIISQMTLHFSVKVHTFFS